jgi:hypothetical protein
MVSESRDSPFRVPRTSAGVARKVSASVCRLCYSWAVSICWSVPDNPPSASTTS